MKLLFDENISYRILRKIVDFFPDSSHVTNIGFAGSEDTDIWGFAKINGYTIVTFDSDYADIATFRGHPPKVIWLRTGNMTTDNIANILIEKRAIIEAFVNSEESKDIACLEIEA